MMKTKLCKGCNKQKVIWKNIGGNRYCKYCWGKIQLKSKPTNFKKLKPISFSSSKRIKETKEYSKLREIYLNTHPMCEAAVSNCSLNASEIHHIKGRNSNYLLCNEWIAVCRNCHDWIELHPKEATEMGYRKSKIR